MFWESPPDFSWRGKDRAMERRRKQESKGEWRKTYMRKRAREEEKAAGRRQTRAGLAQIMN